MMDPGNGYIREIAYFAKMRLSEVGYSCLKYGIMPI